MNFRRLSGLLVSLTFVAGCSSQESSVSGTVYLDETPIGPGSVAFEPIAAGKMATGYVDPSGHYELKTNRDEGLAAGKYRVLVIIDNPDAASRDLRPAAAADRIPAKYTETSTSGLEYDVAPGENTIDVKLSSE
jgi:hypothetical protein